MNIFKIKLKSKKKSIKNLKIYELKEHFVFQILKILKNLKQCLNILKDLKTFVNFSF